MTPLANLAFVAVPLPIETAAPVLLTSVDEPTALRLSLRAQLPNGVVIELRDCELHLAAEVIDAFERVRCSTSTKR